MGDPMPNTYTTTSTTTTSTIFFDKGMLRSKEVILKIAELVFSIIGIICVASAFNPYVSQGRFLNFVFAVGLIVALLLLGLYVTHARDKIAPTLRLNLVELVYSALWCIFCVAGAIAGIVHAQSVYGLQDGILAAGVFALFLAVVYSLETYIMYIAWRTGATMSASRTTTTTQPAV